MAAAYPLSIKSFLTVQDQPGDANHIVPDPDNPSQTVDLTIDRAKTTDEIHDEVIAIEKTIGVFPFTGGNPGVIQVAPGNLINYQNGTGLGREIQALFTGLAAGHADANNSVDPTPLPTHNHIHGQTTGLTSDDHPLYPRRDGGRGFSAPVTSPPAYSSNQLITLAQAQGAGLTAAQVSSLIQSDIANASTHPMKGPDPQRYRMAGGLYYGPTDANGNIYVNYSQLNFRGVLSFVYMKNPFPGQSMLGWYTFQYEEDQLVLLSITNQGAWIQFTEDIVVDRSALVAMTYMVVGV